MGYDEGLTANPWKVTVNSGRNKRAISTVILFFLSLLHTGLEDLKTSEELNLIQEKKRNFAADETKTKVGSSIPDLEDGWKQAPQGNYIL